MTLNNILNYFTKATNNEKLQLLCFTEAAQRYLKTEGTPDQRSLAAVRICVNVHRSLTNEVETPWCDSLALKVSTLNEKYREAVELYLEGNTFDEMGKALGLSAHVAEGRYRRAMRLLAA